MPTTSQGTDAWVAENQMMLADTMTDTAVEVTGPTNNSTARTRGVSSRCLAVAATAAAHSPIVIISASAVAMKPRK